MKHFYFSIVCFFVVFIAQAQIVNIPDANFKSALTNQICVDLNNDDIIDADVDLNNDGEIQVSEALAVTNLIISDYFNNNLPIPVNDITGLEAFTNVTKLTINGLSAPSVNLTALVNLQTLDVKWNSGPLTSINASSLSNLTTITCENNINLSSFNLSGLSNLLRLECYSSGGFNGDLSGMTSLQYLNCRNSGITSLDLSHTPNLVTLICKESSLTSLDLSGLTSLKEVDVSYNQLTSINTNGLPQIEKLNCSWNNLTALSVGGLTTLKELNCNWNNLTALNVGGLTTLKELNCNWNNLTALNVGALSLLTTLNCSGNLLQVLPVTNLTHLKNLDCSANQISTLDVANLTDLETLNVSSNAFSNLSLNSLTNLRDLECGNNPINTLDVANLVNLQNLNVYNCELTALNLPTNEPSLGRLDCSGNQLTSVDVSHCLGLWWFGCGGNLFTTLDLSANFNLRNLDFSYSPNLTYINLKNGNNGDPTSLNAYSSPNLSFICVEESQIQNMINQLSSNGITNVPVHTYCNFTPGGIYNTITGTHTFDFNNNGCDALDQPTPILKININDGTNSGSTFSNVSGQYNFYTNTGSFVITPITENPYFDISPTSATVNFAALNGTTQTQNFCITPVGIHYDVEIALIPILGARPGFDAIYKLVYKNKGNQVLSGNIDLSFNDAILDFVSANPNINNQSLNHLNWNYTALYPFESREITLVLNLNSPQETPAVNINDILHYVATISTNGQDETPIDTIFELDQTVTGSFDPNDKTCLEGNTITPEMVGNYLHYLIRFQNSGTAAAENIVVKDIIDTNKFDISSLQLTSTSHPQVTKITGNKVEFQFQNINLPAEIDDEPGSHGYIAFKIKTKNNLVIGNSVSNKADIYFDYNFPIETNTATSTVALLGLNQFENTTVTVAPNPTKNLVHITSKGNITSVQLFDVQGRILETQLFNMETVDFSLSQKSRGVYFIKIITEKGVKTEKIIKE